MNNFGGLYVYMLLALQHVRCDQQVQVSIKVTPGAYLVPVPTAILYETSLPMLYTWTFGDDRVTSIKNCGFEEIYHLWEARSQASVLPHTQAPIARDVLQKDGDQ